MKWPRSRLGMKTLRFDFTEDGGTLTYENASAFTHSPSARAIITAARSRRRSTTAAASAHPATAAMTA